MKKTICKREYNTETATVIHKITYGFFGDPAGYEEILFQTPDGLYFLYGKGGSCSPYPEEDIRRISKSKADNWMQSHS